METHNPNLPPKREQPDSARPQLSVLFPCYNEAHQIEAVLRSWAELLREEVDSFELVVVNDGSMDGSGRILDRLRKEIPSLRVIHQLNGGQDWALRRGYEAARGRYVLQTESNTRYDPTDFSGLWALRDRHKLVLGRRTRPLDGWLARAEGWAVRRLTRFFFGRCPQEPGLSLRLMGRETLELWLSALPREQPQLNFAVTAWALGLEEDSVGETPIPFRFPTGVRPFRSPWVRLMRVGHSFSLLSRARLRAIPPILSATSPAHAG